MAEIPLVDLKAQYRTIRDEIEAAMRPVLEEAGFVLGRQLAEFEERFASYCGVRHCVGVASGTDALNLMLRAAGVGPGDEVILPAMTFVATAIGVTLAGATPVLADVRRDDALIDVESVEKAITPRTRAILPVHLYGRSADMDSLAVLADRHGLLLFEDAAQAHGAELRGRRAGSLGLAAGFSFYPGKNLGAYGDGGAVTTDDAAIAERLRLLRNWGSRQKYHHEEPGLNSRLDTLQAAILDAKLRHLDDWNARRSAIAARYDALIGDSLGWRRAGEERGSRSANHLYVVRVAHRDSVVAKLQKAGIGAGIHYPFPVHRLNAYRHLAGRPGAFPEAEGWARECLSLPLYPELHDDQVSGVVESLKAAVA